MWLVNPVSHCVADDMASLANMAWGQAMTDGRSAGAGVAASMTEAADGMKTAAVNMCRAIYQQVSVDISIKTRTRTSKKNIVVNANQLARILIKNRMLAGFARTLGECRNISLNINWKMSAEQK